jgi:sarcosine oxidase subunit alpha
VRAVHESLGVIDVSTLGKLLAEGPDAGLFLDRLYPNHLADLAPGRIRYGVVTTDGGRIVDDGTVARLGDELFYVTTTSTGSDSVFEWFEWWNAVWRLDVEVVNVTGALAAVNLAGPRAREALAALTDADSRTTPSGISTPGARGRGRPLPRARIGFVGESATSSTAPSAAPHLWDALLDRAAVPFRARAAARAPARKAHVIVGQDTDSESNLLSAGMPDRQARQGRLRRPVGDRARAEAGSRAARQVHAARGRAAEGGLTGRRRRRSAAGSRARG